MRTWLARKLCPEVFKDAERYHYSMRKWDDLWNWCAYEFPQVGSAAEWVRQSVRQHFMDRETYFRLVEEKRFDLTHIDDISEFRDKLRRGELPFMKTETSR